MSLWPEERQDRVGGNPLFEVRKGLSLALCHSPPFWLLKIQDDTQEESVKGAPVTPEATFKMTRVSKQLLLKGVQDEQREKKIVCVCVWGVVGGGGEGRKRN